jgi:hypothetical protein
MYGDVMSNNSKDIIKARIDELKSIFDTKYPEKNILDVPKGRFREYLTDHQYYHAKIHGLKEAYNLLKGVENWKIKIAE